LAINVIVAANFQIKATRKSINHGYTDTMKTTGNLVGVAIEFTTSMEDGHNDFSGRLILACVQIHGNSPTVVFNCNGAVDMYKYKNFIAITRERFINRIIDYLINQMMQTHGTCGSNIHSRAFPHCG